MNKNQKITRKPYQVPELKEYGNLSSLTQGGGGMKGDGGPTRMTKA